MFKCLQKGNEVFLPPNKKKVRDRQVQLREVLTDSREKYEPTLQNVEFTVENGDGDGKRREGRDLSISM